MASGAVWGNAESRDRISLDAGYKEGSRDGRLQKQELRQRVDISMLTVKGEFADRQRSDRRTMVVLAIC